ncbi:MAG: metalloregulator ArsR/SmtB family transcription factor, partial [Proteobacteria bacterium]|nr:metalloregulator ArsR/SmtB family transcription factor [Pseudomonadota bacterium]
AVKILSALAQPTRFGVFRLLMKYNRQGLAAGAIAEMLKVPQNTLSSYLNLLSNSGLIKSERHGRSLIYTVEIEATKEFIDYLVMDCCDGHPEICALTK